MIRLSFAAPISFVWLTLTMVGCGPCDDFHQVALSSLPPDTLAADRKLFDRHFGGSFDVHVIPERLAHHPETEKLFEELGYTRRDRDVIAFTSLGLKKSDWQDLEKRRFPSLARKPSLSLR